MNPAHLNYLARPKVALSWLLEVADN
ncbi:hypothetical protein CKAH01_15491 [Colletotrichum kahawae]|uniref:Uncharacterized protein n=1 Tax=Colletotrichum kahawae TaxID=34407 RepID=A0AAD9Y6J4_COLKA|nr:hypothetical protein CKAH01_18629 [Colletotrichum kahawae]KAK2764063.1 hypothetical protein CKAH01_15866 [Colletotrichum kahawae]KAK2766321.1 hypothetical protein CKAH01_15491 [Colletotrichum kahawae]